ncbi:unnamed protein product [Closterium sp. Naga37s-1]|nr:unnamed protein product [Closterium sp. Naga37s-1]
MRGARVCLLSARLRWEDTRGDARRGARGTRRAVIRMDNWANANASGWEDALRMHARRGVRATSGHVDGKRANAQAGSIGVCLLSARLLDNRGLQRETPTNPFFMQVIVVSRSDKCGRWGASDVREGRAYVCRLLDSNGKTLEGARAGACGSRAGARMDKQLDVNASGWEDAALGTWAGRGHGGTSALGHLCTWAPLHVGTSARGHLCTWALLHVGTSARGHFCTWTPLHGALRHGGISARGSPARGHFGTWVFCTGALRHVGLLHGGTSARGHFGTWVFCTEALRHVGLLHGGTSARGSSARGHFGTWVFCTGELRHVGTSARGHFGTSAGSPLAALASSRVGRVTSVGGWLTAVGEKLVANTGGME